MIKLGIRPHISLAPNRRDTSRPPAPRRFRICFGSGSHAGGEVEPNGERVEAGEWDEALGFHRFEGRQQRLYWRTRHFDVLCLLQRLCRIACGKLIHNACQ